MSRPVVNTIVSGPKYAPSTYQTIVLKSNQDFKAVVESETNKKYIIKYDFDLGGETVTMPEGCLIEMDGGTISNGTMVGDHTILIYFQDYEDCIKSVTMQGTWKYNNPRDGIMTENIYDENLDETQKQFNARVNEALEEVDRRAQAVIPLPDEEDLTTDGDHNIKLKNKAYAPAQFSGLGKIYLRKNIVEIALPFDGFVEDVTLESEGLTSAPAAIFFDSTNGIFVGVDNLLDPKYYGTWLGGSAYNTEGTLADDDEFKNTSNDTYYKYDDGALVSISTPTTKNILTKKDFQDSHGNPIENTIYIIQYDYDLNGAGSNGTDPITIPEGCILQFDGGSLSNGTIRGEKTDVKAGLAKIFNSDVILGGSWKVEQWYIEWFGGKADGVTDNTNIFNHFFNTFKSGVVLKLMQGVYIANMIDLSECMRITIIGHSESIMRLDPMYTTKEKSSMIRCSQDVDYVIRTEKEVNGTWYRSGGITIRDVGLDGNGYATTGFVCTFGTNLNNVTVHRCKNNGIETGYSAYPTYLEKCISERNGGNGFFAGTENNAVTTCYWIRDCEFMLNKKYGMYIEQGVAVSIENCLIQSNYTGGVKIKPVSETRWLYNITFRNLYTEDNGLLDPSHADYEGNYTIYIEGSNTDPNVFAGKIDGIAFDCCTINYDNGENAGTYKIEGTRRLKLINTTIGGNIDPTKNNNIDYYNADIISNIRLGAGPYPTNSLAISTGSYCQVVKDNNIATYNIKLIFTNITEWEAGATDWCLITGLIFSTRVDKRIPIIIKLTDTSVSPNTVEYINTYFEGYINTKRMELNDGTHPYLPPTGIIEVVFTAPLDGIR